MVYSVKKRMKIFSFFVCPGLRRGAVCIGLLLSAVLQAREIPVERAAAIARNVLSKTASPARMSAGNIMLKWTGEQTALLSAGETPAYYVYQSVGGGFVIVAGDDAVPPLLAYSATGTFETEGMPDNVAAWMDYLREGVRYLRRQGAEPSAAVKAQWLSAENGTARISTPVTQYATAQWSQGAPYNELFPHWEGRASWVGCVPLAGAIILRYYQYPQHGHRTLPGYDYIDAESVSRHVDGYPLGHEYVWEDMPLDNNTSQWTASQKAQVQQLLLDCAVMCRAKISSVSSSGTGATTDNMLKGMQEYLFYHPDAQHVSQYSYSSAEWSEMLKDNLNKYGPLIYSARASAGHCFVVDGYDTDGRFHINFGWGGTSNGYYTFPNFGGFPNEHRTVIRLRADDSDLNDKMTFRYDADTGIITIKTEPEVRWTLLDASGRSETAGVTFDVDGVMTFDAAVLTRGPYVLRLEMEGKVTELKLHMPKR